MEDKKLTPQTMQAYQELNARLAMAAKLGMTYGGDRDIYDTLGYKTELTFLDYFTQYDRQDIANAIINRPAKATWRGEVAILESKDADATPLEKAWKEMTRTLKLKSIFLRLDKMVGIGSYGVLLLGLSDVARKEDLTKPVTGKNLKLQYIRPFSEYNAKIASYEERTNQPRYGLPTIYELEITSPVSTSSRTVAPTQTIKVHHSRVIHVVENPLENEIEGTPRLKAVYNRLQDIEKLSGGSAEMFWRNARPGYQGKLQDGFKTTTEEEEGLQQQITEYEHNLRRFLLTEGVELSALTAPVADPASHLDIQIQLISSQTGIPKRILTGSERGELASSQDNEQWLSLIADRREEFAEPAIIRPFIERCMEYGILPAVQDKDHGFSIQWDDLFAPSDKEQAEVGRTRAAALKEYASEPMSQMIVPPNAFLEYFLGLNQEEVTVINEMVEQEMLEEVRQQHLQQPLEQEEEQDQEQEIDNDEEQDNDE